MPIDWQPLIEIVHAAQRFVITSHVRPDGDALGSELGLAGILTGLGKSVRIINPSATPDHLSFLDPEGTILKIKEDVSIEQACETDVHIVVDTSAWQQINSVRKVLEQTSARKVVIDHHVSSDDMGATEFKDTTAAATGVLIAEFASALGVTLTARQAQALFCATATDTGWFRFPNADARTYRTVAALIDAGAQPSLLYRELYERSSLERLKLHSVVLSRVDLACDNRLAHTYVERKDFAETGAHPTDTEDLVNVALAINGLDAAFILVEQIDGRVKASLRSRSELNVAAIAENFGGGGHKQAAGAMLHGPIPEARQKLLSLFAAAMNTPAEDSSAEE
ncbi:MAG: bifunctional oligoribonuclease/PAP phosphatase NrnA [Planctomycetaceae bacterium]|nr:bifunctional oligoribonuclease/PAP phosphatase NrnA [Planctomycetaceae bacterium]